MADTGRSGKKVKIKEGDVFPTNEGGSVTVVSYEAWNKIVVKHMDERGHTATVRSDHIASGRIKNPFHPSTFGVGYIGVGEYTSRKAGKNTAQYITWRNMIQRCYSAAYQAKYPSYKGCSVAREWHNFQVFARWFDGQPHSLDPGFSLDKDLIYLGNKTYSPDACSFVPHEVNKVLVNCKSARGPLLQGVSIRGNAFIAKVSSGGDTLRLGTFPTPEMASSAYVTSKKSVVRAVAEKWKRFLDPRVYENLCRWEIAQ